MSFITSPGVIVPPLTAGGVAYGTGSQAKVTSAGTAGQVLTSAGAGVPVFATPSAPVGASLVYLSTVNASAATTVDIESTFDATYDVYKIFISNLSTTANNGIILVNFKMGGVYVNSPANAYNYAINQVSGPTYFGVQTNAASAIMLGYFTPIGNGAGQSATVEMTLYKPSSTSLYKTMQFVGTYGTGGGGAGFPVSTYGNVAFGRDFTTACTGIRLFENSGSLITATVRVYGIKNS